MHRMFVAVSFSPAVFLSFSLPFCRLQQQFHLLSQDSHEQSVESLPLSTFVLVLQTSFLPDRGCHTVIETRNRCLEGLIDPLVTLTVTGMDIAS